MNITQALNLYREMSRHLWNTYLIHEADDDTIDTFSEICKLLFEEQILNKLGIDAPFIPMDKGKSTIEEFVLFASHSGKLPLHVNRDIPASGYWDYPVHWIPPEENPRIHPICFFDFDTFNWRNIEFYRAMVEDCPSHPEINGREVLIPCDKVEIKFVGSK